MGRPAAKKTTASSSATPAQDEIGQYMETINAKQLFFGSVIGMGWRLALVVIIPIVAGVKLDSHFKTAPSYTLAGLMIAAFSSVVVVTKTVQEVNRLQAEGTVISSKKTAKRNKENK